MSKIDYLVKRGLWRITEMKDDEVFKTEFVMDVWVPSDLAEDPVPPSGYILASADEYHRPVRVK